MHRAGQRVRLGEPVQNQAADAAPGQHQGGGEPGRPGSDDHYRHMVHRTNLGERAQHRHAGAGFGGDPAALPQRQSDPVQVRGHVHAENFRDINPA
ncbi:hypothetical protein Asi03nite_09260 [Actinoplanes siamensis]|uniref:Uncharacterized protein n=1 Tax=Actinoplanes siamensis TaxID=1223317 RepID=A0A919N340_9ACTN|nr:hypothetical protein Asi03nite_09260 [Actinoplanes siamensis]